jgi:trypsin
VTKISTHPSYDRKTNAYDVAIWKVQLVSGDLSLVNSAIISLDDGSQPVADNTTVTIAGWGTVSSSGNSSPILLETQVNILNQEYCQKEYSTLDTTSICAAAPGKDTCQGDSGGPLFTQAADGSVKLIGLTSYGQGCADPSFAGVYSRVSSLMTWINYFVPNPQTPTLDDFDKDFGK